MVTLKDIAAKAGVSATIVSHVLNQRTGRARVSEEKRTQILKAAQELGYVPHRSARTLVTKRNYTIGILINRRRYDSLKMEDRGVLFNIIEGANLAGEPRGYRTVHTLVDLRNEVLYEEPSFIRDRSVDALIIFGYINRAIAQRLQATGLPCIHIGTNIEAGIQMPCIYADIIGSTLRIVDQAVSHGISAIHLYQPRGPGPEEISQALLAHTSKHHPGLKTSIGLSKDLYADYDEALTHGRALAKLQEAPTLIFCNISNYIPLSIGYYGEVINRPKKTQFVCFSPDGYEENRFGNDGHRLAHIIVPLQAICKEATTRLIHSLDAGHLDPQHKAFPCIIRPGDSAPFIRPTSSSKRQPTSPFH